MLSIGPEQLASLFDSHARSLLLYARQWCPGLQAEDVVQDAFVALARSRPIPSQPVAWLYRAVRNAAISALRGDRRRRLREAHVAGRESWFATVDDQIDAANATAALATLDRDEREVIVARLWGGLTFEQVAEVVGCSPPTAYRRYQSALTRLQQKLEDACTPQIRA